MEATSGAAVRVGSLVTGDFSVFNRKFPFFARPTELGAFSLDGNRKYCNDSRNLKHYIAPRRTNPNFDLSAGYDQAVHRDFGKEEKLDSMLKWIIHNREKVIIRQNEECKLAANFVCYRGLLTAIAATPYEDKNGWIILATKYRDTIYLCAVDTEEDIDRRARMTKRDKLMAFWGYKFEQYVCSDSPHEKPTPNLPLNVCEEYNIVCKSKLGNLRLLFGAEVDCQAPGSKRTYLELKTNRIFTSDRQEQNCYRFKFLKWWLQSFLIGISTIVCGFRNDAGFVSKIECFETVGLPKIAEGKWLPTVCFNFCEEFLGFVLKHVEESHVNSTYKFQWQPKGNIICEQLNDSSVKFDILPDWYICEFDNFNV